MALPLICEQDGLYRSSSLTLAAHRIVRWAVLFGNIAALPEGEQQETGHVRQGVGAGSPFAGAFANDP